MGLFGGPGGGTYPAAFEDGAGGFLIAKEDLPHGVPSAELGEAGDGDFEGRAAAAAAQPKGGFIVVVGAHIVDNGGLALFFSLFKQSRGLGLMVISEPCSKSG